MTKKNQESGSESCNWSASTLHSTPRRFQLCPYHTGFGVSPPSLEIYWALCFYWKLWKGGFTCNILCWSINKKQILNHFCLIGKPRHIDLTSVMDLHGTINTGWIYLRLDYTNITPFWPWTTFRMPEHIWPWLLWLHLILNNSGQREPREPQMLAYLANIVGWKSTSFPPTLVLFHLAKGNSSRFANEISTD
jgi:hypothetical protein